MATGLARLVVGSNPARTFRRALGLIVAGALLITYGILPVRGEGPSMQPTIQDGQLMIVGKLSYKLREPRRGEIAAVRLTDNRAVLIKRILAGPGDTIAFKQGVVEVNGIAIAEPYVVHRMPWDIVDTTLGPAEFFVVGDNRGMPMELHTFGTVSRDRLIGPVLW